MVNDELNMVVPEDWNIKHLDDFGYIVSGGTPSTSVPSYWNGMIPWCTPTDITGTEGIIISKTEKCITEDGLKNSSADVLPSGSLLLCTRATIGDSKINSIPMATNQGFKNVIPFKDTCIKYLYYLLQTKKREMLEKATASTFAEISKSALCEIPLQAPEKQEQEQIAQVLFDIDALITDLQKLIKKKRNIFTGTMQSLLSGKIRISDSLWEKYVIGDIGDFYSGLTGKSKDDFGKGNARYITFLNVLNNTVIDISKLESVQVNEDEYQNEVLKGDLFFNTSSETPEEVGMCAVLMDSIRNTYLNSFCFGFRLKTKKVHALFFSYYFNSQEGRKIMRVLAQGATRFNLSKDYFSQTEIELPPYEDQVEIAQTLADMEGDILSLEKKCLKYKAMKQGMMEELLTGKVRLM